MDKSINSFLNNSKLYKSINESEQMMSKKRYLDNIGIDNLFFMKSKDNQGDGVTGNVVGSGDNSANANNIVMNYDSSSWGQIVDLGQLTEGIRMTFEPTLSDMSNFSISVGVSTGQVTSKTYTKTLYPAVTDVNAEVTPFRNSGLSYRFMSGSSHSFYLNGVLNNSDGLFNFTGTGGSSVFWLFNNSEYITFTKGPGSSVFVSNQRGQISFTVGGTVFCYVVIYKLTEQLHNPIRFTFRSLNVAIDYPFGMRTSSNIDWRRHEHFTTHPQNYACLSVIPSRLRANRVCGIKFEGINDIVKQKIFIGLTSQTFKRDYSDIAIFDQYVGLRFTIDSSGPFQAIAKAFTQGKMILATTGATNCVLSCDGQSYTLPNGVTNYLFVGVKYDSPVNFKCLYYDDTSEELSNLTTNFYSVVPRYLSTVNNYSLKLPSDFRVNITVSPFGTNTWGSVSFAERYAYNQSDGFGIPNVINTRIALNSASDLPGYYNLTSQSAGYLPSVNSPILVMIGATHNNVLTVFKVGNSFYIKSGSSSFGFRLITSTSEYYMGLNYGNTPVTESDGSLEGTIAFSSFSTSVSEPVGMNYFTTEGIVLFTQPSIVIPGNVGTFNTLGGNIWGDTSFDSNLRNAFTWTFTSTFSLAANKCIFFGLVLNSTTLTASTYTGTTNFKNALTAANAWGFYLENTGGSSSGYYRNGVLQSQAYIQFNWGMGFYNGSIFVCSYHPQGSEITQWYKIGSGLTRSNAYQFVWGVIGSSESISITLNSATLKGYLD